MTATIYARKGEWATCERGHRVFRFARSVHFGEIPRPQDCEAWQQPEPKVGEPIPVCAKCGAAWARNVQPWGMVLHFPNGWRGAQADLGRWQYPGEIERAAAKAAAKYDPDDKSPVVTNLPAIMDAFKGPTVH